MLKFFWIPEVDCSAIDLLHGLVTTMGKDSLYCIFVFVQNIYCVIPGRLDNITGSLGRKWPRKGISFEGASPASSTSCEESDFADSEAPLAVS